MANNYFQSSSFINIPPELMPRAREIVEGLGLSDGSDDPSEACYTEYEFRDGGIWIHDNGEWFDAEEAEAIVSALVNGLNLPGIHVVSWATTCSKPRIDEFDGGAFAVAAGQETVWVGAASLRAYSDMMVQMREAGIDLGDDE